LLICVILWNLIWLDHGIIWTLFDFGFQPIGMHQIWRWADPHWVCRKQQCIKWWYYNSSWGFKYNTSYPPGGACKRCAGTWNGISAYSFWLTQQTLLHTIRGDRRSIKSFGVLVVIIDQDTTIMYWSWI